MRKAADVERAQKEYSKYEIGLFFSEELKRRYWAEKSLLEILPKMSKAATSYELLSAVVAHEKVTNHQIERLMSLFANHEERVVGLRYDIMEKLISSGEKALVKPIGFERDNAIIGCCKSIMSHEISVYEKLLFYANVLEDKVACEHILQAIYEEKSARAQFSEIILTDIYFDKAG